MAINQFVVTHRELHTQINVIENLVSGDLFKEAAKLLSAAEKTCESLESLINADNEIQKRIVTNRRWEIKWIRDAIQEASLKKTKTTVKRRKAK